MQQYNFRVIFHTGTDDEDIDSGVYKIYSETDYSICKLKQDFAQANKMLSDRNMPISYAQQGYVSIDALTKGVEHLSQLKITPISERAEYCIEQWYK